MKTLPFSIMSSAAVLFAAGCAQQPVTDNTPRHATNVLTAKYVVSGFIMPDSTGEQTVYTRADRRRMEQTIEYDSWISRRLLGNADYDDIARTDKNLSWHLNDKQKTYYECPLSGCTGSIWESLAASEDDSDEQEQYYDPTGGDNCNLTPSKVSFEVDPQHQTRTVNGFPAKQHQMQWRLTSEDEMGRQDINILKMDFWMTEPTADMQAGWELNEAFQDNYLQAVDASDNPLSRFLSNEIYKAIAMFSGDIGGGDNAVDKLNALKGFPVSIKINWYSQSNACPEVRQANSESDSSIDYSDPAGALSSLATGFLQKAAKKRVAAAFTPDPNEPIFSYIYDVTSSQIRDEHDSLFQVPAGYKLQDRQ